MNMKTKKNKKKKDDKIFPACHFQLNLKQDISDICKTVYSTMNYTLRVCHTE